MEHRIVIMNGHIVALFKSVGWWTCSKSNTNSESDFAVWEYSDANLNRAKLLVGVDTPIINVTQRWPLRVRDGEWWYAGLMDLSPKPNTPEGYRQALRELAREICNEE